MAAPTHKCGGGKSGLQRAGCFLTGRRGDLTDSATENIPPRTYNEA